MNIASISVRRAIFLTMIYVVVVGFGFYGLSQLELDLFPDISFPSVVVITTYEGSSPEDIETLVSRPIEGAVASVKDAEEILSTSKNGTSIVQVNFDWGKDMEQAETDVRRAIDMYKGLLPTDAKEPMIFAFDPSLQPVVGFVVTGPYPLDELRRIAINEVQPRLERLPGIASAEIAGGLEREIQVVLDPAKVSTFGLNPAAVVGAIYQENAQVPGGSIKQGALDFTIQATGKYRNLDEIGEVVVGARPSYTGMTPVRLKDVAKIVDTFHEDERRLEVDRTPAVFVMVRKQSGANTVKASEAVMNALPEIQRATAANLEFKTIFDMAEFINLSLGNLSDTGLQGVIITFLVLLLFLRNVRSSLIVASAIPVSVIVTFGVMYLMDMSLNIISMTGLALSIGMLVDNAIVVLENIFRLRSEGMPVKKAAIEGASSVFLAVSGSTLTTVAVFFPVLFVPGIAGVLFRDMSITICVSLTVSLLVAMTLIPLAASRLLGSRRGSELLKKAQSKDPLTRPRDAYGRALRWALAHRKWVGGAVAGLVVGTGLLLVILPTEFMAEDDNSQLFVSAEAAVGSNIDEAYAVMQETLTTVERVVKPEERKMIALDLGVGEGFVAIFSKGVHAATIRVPLVLPGKRDRSQQEIEAALREELKKIPGLKATVAQPFNMMGGEGDLEVQIRGHDLETSRKVGLELRDKLAAMPEMSAVTFSMDDQKPEVRIRFDRAKLAQIGLSAAAAGTALSTYFMGRIAGRYAEGGDEYDILVRYDKKHRLDIDEIRRMPISTPSGGIVPLANVADVSVGLGPVDISRLDQRRITRLNCYLKAEYVSPDGSSGRKDLGGSISKIDKILAAYTWPKDFSYYIGGTAEDFLKSFRYLGIALLIAIILVYAVMAAQFESLREPFIIIMTVPLAAIGVIPFFAVTRTPLDVAAMIGGIILVGIVVNNGIVMVDCANQLRAQYPDKKDAIWHASLLRMRPVLMTALTTIVAMIPLALGIGEGSAGWEGMAKAVIGGMVTSTFLTLFVVPTMYTIFGPAKVVDPSAEIESEEPLKEVSREPAAS